MMSVMERRTQKVKNLEVTLLLPCYMHKMVAGALTPVNMHRYSATLKHTSKCIHVRLRGCKVSAAL